MFIKLIDLFFLLFQIAYRIIYYAYFVYQVLRLHYSYSFIFVCHAHQVINSPRTVLCKQPIAAIALLPATVSFLLWFLPPCSEKSYLKKKAKLSSNVKSNLCKSECLPGAAWQKGGDSGRELSSTQLNVAFIWWQMSSFPRWLTCTQVTEQEEGLSEPPSISTSLETEYIKNNWFGGLANCQFKTSIHRQKHKGLSFSSLSEHTD